MRRVLSLAILAACLALTSPGFVNAPAHAQATADQLNKLSLEALTAPPPRGSGSGRGYSRPTGRPATQRSFYRSYVRGHGTQRRVTSYHRLYGLPAAHPPRYARAAMPSHGHAATHHTTMRPAAYRRR